MSKKICKLFSVFLVGIMVVSLMAGCNNNATKETGTIEEGKKVSKVSEKPIEIDWLGYNTYGKPNNESPIIKKIEEKYNVKFNFWFVDDQRWNEVLSVKLASGSMPDYVKIKGNIPKLVKQGVVAPVTDEMLEKIPNYMKIVEKYDINKELWLDTLVDNVRYGIRKINLNGSYPTTLAWRTDWLKNVGINKIPETLKEFEEAMYKFTYNDPDQNGKDDTYGMSDTTIAAVFGAFGRIPIANFSGKGGQSLFWGKKDGKLCFEAIQPEMKEPLILLQKWYEDGIIDPEFITGENKGGYWAVSHAFINGKVGVTGKSMSYHWCPPLTENDCGGTVYQEMLKVNPNAKFGETFDLGKAPIGPTGKSGTNTWGCIGEIFSFTTKCVKDQRKVDVILKLINDNCGDFEQYTLVRKGIKDVHYTINEDGVYNFSKQYSKSQPQTEVGINVLTGGILNPDFEKKYQLQLYEFMDKYRGGGYIGEKIPASDVCIKYDEDLKKLAVDYYIGVITGTKKVEDFDKFTATFRDKGGEECEKDVNEKYKNMMSK